jgi:NAD-dependent SIR2 family protein deacetylase
VCCSSTGQLLTIEVTVLQLYGSVINYRSDSVLQLHGSALNYRSDSVLQLYRSVMNYRSDNVLQLHGSALNYRSDCCSSTGQLLTIGVTAAALQVSS